MLGTAIIVFREVLEAALIVSIVMAGCKGLPRRNFWVSSGLIGGLLGAGLVAAFAGSIAAAVSGMGQEFFNATILFLAVAMLGWHNLWMSRHGRALAREVSAVGEAVQKGARPLYAIAVVTGVAVLREGSETVLFVYGIAAGGGDGAGALLAGGGLGLAAGVALGVGLYFGLLRIPLKHLFTVTNWMILLLAAGMASQGAGFLEQADVLPPLGNGVWDSSALLSEGSVPGKVLHTLIGYVSRPDGIQVAFYAATLVILGSLMVVLGRNGRLPRSGRGAVLSRAAMLLLGAASASLVATSAARAEFKLHYPIVDYREIEFEHNGDTTFDRSNSGKSNNQSYTNEFEIGATPFWMVGLEAELAAAPGENLRYEATTLENLFQLTPQGKYWADLGFFAEYQHAASRADADSVTFGPLVQKQTEGFVGNGTLHTLNLLFTKQIGHNRNNDTLFSFTWQSRLLLNPLFEPGVEIFSQVADIESSGKFEEQQHRVGPMLAGVYSLAPYGKIKYEAGYLFGVTRATENGAVRWRLEYEHPF